MKPKHYLRLQALKAGIRLPDAWLDHEMLAMRRMAKVCSAVDVVIDLGAHIGKSAIEFSHVARKVIAFEPNPTNFAQMGLMTKRYRNIEIVNKAVSFEDGTTQLYFEDAKPGRFYEGATIVGGKSNVSYANHVDVETISAKTLLESVDAEQIVVKMDIEGAEYMVLDAILESDHLDRIKKIYVECHVDRIPDLAGPKEQVLAKARELGFIDRIDFEWP